MKVGSVLLGVAIGVAIGVLWSRAEVADAKQRLESSRWRDETARAELRVCAGLLEEWQALYEGGRP